MGLLNEGLCAGEKHTSFSFTSQPAMFQRQICALWRVVLSGTEAPDLLFLGAMQSVVSLFARWTQAGRVFCRLPILATLFTCLALKDRSRHRQIHPTAWRVGEAAIPVGLTQNGHACVQYINDKEKVQKTMQEWCGPWRGSDGYSCSTTNFIMSTMRIICCAT